MRTWGKALLAAAALLAQPAAWGHPGDHPPAADSAQRAAKMAAAARTFLASLEPGQRARIVRGLDDNAARTDWSNLPSAIYPRTAGVPLGELSDAQRRAFHDLLAVALSGTGYGEAATIMWIDDVLSEIEAQRLASGAVPPELRERTVRVQASRSSGNYWVSFFGDPATPRWGWSVNGHHFAANMTVVDGKIAFTPLFLGANPQTVPSGRYAGWRVLDHKIADAFTLFASLRPDQRAAALVGAAVDPAQFTGKGAVAAGREPSGLSADRMTADQRARLMALVEDFVGFASSDAAAAQMAAIRADGPGKLRLAWWGDPDDREKRFMYRIAGPAILIEYVREPRADGTGDNHVHAIVRDPRNDYGADWLKRHYTEAPHPTP